MIIKLYHNIKTRHDDHDSYYLARAVTPSWEKFEIPKYVKINSLSDLIILPGYIFMLFNI